jgi:hypothetical protein
MTIENTSERDPMLHLLGVMSEGTSGYITGMEAAGQRQLLASSQLPKDGPWDELTALGFVKGEPVDDLFVNATLPEGWKREGSDHAMWSYLLDQRGIRMVAIFYKAAFYDRRAFMRFEHPGYSASTEVLYGDDPVALPSQWPLFTDEERADFRAGLDRMREHVEDSPSVYGKYAGRLAAADALLAGGAA